MAAVTVIPARAQVAHSPAHCYKRAEVAAKAFISFFIQACKGTESRPFIVMFFSLNKARLLFDSFNTKS